MKWTKWLGLGLVLLLVLAISGIALAQKKDRKGNSDKTRQDRIERMQEDGIPNPMARISKRLGIDKAKMNKLQQIHRDVEKEQIRLRADLQIARMDLEDTVKTAKSSDNEIRKAAERLGKLQSQEIEIRIKALLEAKKLLTPAQYEKMVQVMAFMHNRRGPMRMQRSMMQRWNQRQEPMMRRQGPPQRNQQGFAPHRNGQGEGPMYGFNHGPQNEMGPQAFAPRQGYGHQFGQRYQSNPQGNYDSQPGWQEDENQPSNSEPAPLQPQFAN